jgi:hypothetical protein
VVPGDRVGFLAFRSYVSCVLFQPSHPFVTHVTASPHSLCDTTGGMASPLYQFVGANI